MYDATLIRVHGPKGEGCAVCSHTLSGVSRHRTQLGFARRAKVFYVADNALALWKLSTESLIDEMLKCFQQLAAFVEQKRGIGTLYLKQTTLRGFTCGCAQFETDAIKDGVKKILSLDTCFTHFNQS